MSRRLRAAVKNAVLFPVYAIVMLAFAALAVAVVGVIVHSIFPLGPTDSVLVGICVIFVISLAGVGAWAGWSDADE